MFDIPLNEPQLAGNEWKYVKECLDTGWVSAVGAFVDRFERALERQTGAAHAVAVTSGTAALHLGLVALGVGVGDEVLVSDLTFIAPANAITYVGARPVLIDVNPTTWQMDVALVETFLARCERRGSHVHNPRTGARVAAIVPVHILGGGVDMDRLRSVAAEFGVDVIEDATESLGASLDGRALGRFGRCGCLSFNGNKTITTGGGGAVLSDDETLAKRARYFSTQAKDDAREFRHDAIGYNYRLSNVLAAIGTAQLERLDAILARKRDLERNYRRGLDDVRGLSFMQSAPGITPSSWLTTIRVPGPAASGSRALIEALARDRIEARPLWTPMHMNRPHAGAELIANGASVAASLHAECVSLPSSASLTDHELERVVSAVRAFFERARDA